MLSYYWSVKNLVETMTDANYADYGALLPNTPVQVESWLNIRELAAKNIALFVKSDKTEFMRYNQDCAIFSLNDKPLKFVNQFEYLGSSISSTESDVKKYIGKAWVINRLLTL